MRKHIIRVLIVMFAACLGLAVFAGCTNEGEKQTYTVSYAAGGGTGTAPSAEKYEEGATFKVKANPFTYEGHTFKTWNDGTKDVAAGSDYTMPAKNVTFTAKWEDNSAEQVTVTFSLGDYKEGTAPQAQKVKKGGDVTLPTPPTWEGHTFLGWKIGDDAALKQAGLKVAVNADVTATAQWELAKEQVTVSFDLGGVPPLNEAKPETAWATPEAVKTNKDEEYTLPFAPAWWAGHMFAGWKVDDGAVKKAGEKITPSANVKLTAQWKEEQSITGAMLDVDNDAVYVVISGKYEGYTDAAMLDAFENCNQRVLSISVCLNHDPWDYLEPDIQFEAEDGIYTATIDVTGLEKDGYFICECRNGYGNVKSVTRDQSETLNNVKYQLSGSVGSDLTLTISDASKVTEFTDITLVQESDKIYLVYSGTFAGYTETEFKAYLEDEATFTFYGNGGAKGQKPASRVATVSGDTWTIKFDVTDMPDDIEYALCWKDFPGASPDLTHPKTDSTDIVLKQGIKKYTMLAHAYGGYVRLKIETEKGTHAVTGIDLALDETAQKVYLTLSGTFDQYTEAEFKDLFTGTNKLYVHFWDSAAGSETPASVEVTVDGKNWTAKCDVTNLKDGELRNILCDGELHVDTIVDKTVVLGERVFVLQKSNGYGHAGLRVGAKFARPSSAWLELTPDKGNGTDENFGTEIDRAFFVISGKYFSEVSEADAKTFFSKDKYPFEFGSYNSTKDRIRRISIDTEAHTYTVKFDVTWLPAGEHFCRFNDKGGDGDLKLSNAACKDNTVKSVGSTYTLTNYNGKEDHWGCIVLKVERNYAVSEVKLEDAEGTPTLVVNGTFESDKFTKEDIKKFLEDEDVRSMCVDFYEGGWKKMTTVVTTEEGKFTVKVALSDVANATYQVCIDCSGYGGIKLEPSDPLTAGGKLFTFAKNGDGEITLTVADAPVEKTYEVSSAKVEEAEGKINLVLTGTYAGYSDEDIKALLTDIYYDIQHNDNLDHMGWDRHNKFARTVAAQDGTWTLTLDITLLGAGSYAIHFDSTDGVGGTNDNTKYCEPTDATVNGKQFEIGTKTFKFVFVKDSGKAEEFWGSLGMIVTDTAPASKTITFTKAQLTEEDGKVYLVLTATIENFTEADLKTMIYVGEHADQGQMLWEPIVTVDGNNVTIKFDFTGAVNGWWWGHYIVNYGASNQLNCVLEEKTITKDGKTYQLKHNDGIDAGANEQIIVIVDDVKA